MVVLDIQQEVRECGNLRRPRRYGHIKQKVFVSVNDGGILMPKVIGKLLSNHHALALALVYNSTKTLSLHSTQNLQAACLADELCVNFYFYIADKLTS